MADTPIYVDNTYGTIATGLTVVQTSITLTTGHGARFPAVVAGQYLAATLLNSSNVLEEIHITAHSAASDTLTVTRGANGTTAKVWNAGDRIECRLTSEHMTNTLFTGGPLGTATSGNVTNLTGTATGIVAGAIPKTVTVGYSATPYSGGTVSTGTYLVNEALGAQQYIVSNGTFTMAPPTNATVVLLQVVNGASVGPVTATGTGLFTKVVGSFSTSTGDKFACVVMKTQDYSMLQIQALQ